MTAEPSGAPYDAREIANFFLDKAEEDGGALTIMALIKIIYFAHGWHLALFSRPLVKNEFEAWQHGPVIRVVYDSFPAVGDKIIMGRAAKFDPVTGAHFTAEYGLEVREKEFLTHIYRAYSHLHAFELSDITHESGSPWHELWEASTEQVHPGMRIDNERIRFHFLRKHNEMREH